MERKQPESAKALSKEKRNKQYIEFVTHMLQDLFKDREKLEGEKREIETEVLKMTSTNPEGVKNKKALLDELKKDRENYKLRITRLNKIIENYQQQLSDAGF